MLRIFILSTSVFFLASCDSGPTVVVREPLNLTFSCKEPLPSFSLGQYSNPSARRIEELCSCVWNAFPAGGWEREVSRQVTSRRDPGSQRLEALRRSFGSAMKACGAGSL